MGAASGAILVAYSMQYMQCTGDRQLSHHVAALGLRAACVSAQGGHRCKMVPAKAVRQQGCQ
jgi:hypothetical protein